jgi:hypothetical protein
VKDATKRLTEALRKSGAVPTLDPGRNMTHPCTFCGRKPDKGYFRLRDIGRYPGGEIIERPVCEDCSPLAEPLERGLAQKKLLEGLPLPPDVVAKLGEHERVMAVVEAAMVYQETKGVCVWCRFFYMQDEHDADCPLVEQGFINQDGTRRE